MDDKIVEKREKNFTRIIYSIACFVLAIKTCFNLVITQKSYIGIFVASIFLLSSIMFLDRSNFLPIKISKLDSLPNEHIADQLGFIAVIYLFIY